MIVSSFSTFSQDTIAACATPAGEGGVGVIRVSGPLTSQIASAILGSLPAARYATFTNFMDGDKQVIDQGIALYFPAPHSFTGEDVLELHCHGGPVIIDCLLRRAFELGARPAKPGEFSERAFLNGKIDLAQAEAIADLISASSEQAAHNAMRSLQGVFSERVHKLREKIAALRVSIEAAIDFSSEDIEIIAAEKIAADLAAILETCQNIEDAAAQGVLIQEGLKVVIAGKPNVGKSSLLNALSGENIAIVTPIAGTTRDLVRTRIALGGIKFELIDTAGLRESADIVEQEGIRRAEQEIINAQHVLLLVDASDEDVLKKNPEQLWQDHFGKSSSLYARQIPASFTIIYNKIDLANLAPSIETRDGIDGINRIYISAKDNKGVDALRQYLKTAFSRMQHTEGTFSARRRHLAALENAKQHLKAAQGLVNAATLELLAEELRFAQHALGEIVGDVVTEDLLSAIFSSFCIGK